MFSRQELSMTRLDLATSAGKGALSLVLLVAPGDITSWSTSTRSTGAVTSRPANCCFWAGSFPVELEITFEVEA